MNSVRNIELLPIFNDMKNIYGIGVGKNLKLAEYWYERALENGNFDASENLERVRSASSGHIFVIFAARHGKSANENKYASTIDRPSPSMRE